MAIRATVLEGDVRPGMLLYASLNSSLSVHAPISDVTPETDQIVTLSIGCDDDLDFALWIGFNIGDGEVLEIREVSDDAAAV